MGQVFEAELLSTGRRVALKVMNHALASEADRKRFLREGRLAASVNHPNVVHIHSGEEVAGIPVIAMELVRGGTLADQLRTQGPLPVAAAVAATLQVIAGLEAAHAAGVLHRDVKPANCFLSPDGTVKVGDFGLSVSTLARGESLITVRGTVLGTPAYAPPEQLRGEELSVAADIYSVGATLYHLVVGRPPFSADDLVRLISLVLDKPPEAPNTVQPSLPAELSRVILRCLAKDPRTRFQTYHQLRNALLPFESRETEPAPRPLRLLAGVIDEFLASIPALAVIFWAGSDPLEQVLRDRTSAAFALWLGALGWSLAYYGVFEGIWGAALGKLACGLRVVGPDRHSPGLLRALARAAIFHAASVLPGMVSLALTPAHFLRESLLRGENLASAWLSPLLFLALFLTMRQRNGWAAVQDLSTRTRVVVHPRSQHRPTLAELCHDTELRLRPGGGSLAHGHVAESAPISQLGPYEVRTTLVREADEAVYLAHDPQLRRMVWIHQRPAAKPAVPPARQELSRPARLRWLNHGQLGPSRWDAYEAIEGLPLNAIDRPIPWHAARHWLLDLARECASSSEPDLGPPPSLDRIWVSSTGRAFLLDIPSPQPIGGPPPVPPAPLSEGSGSEFDCQHFLSTVAQRVLEGPAGATAEPKTTPRPPRAPVPLTARDFLERMSAGKFENAELVAGNLESLAHRPARVDPGRRAASLLIVPSGIALLSLLISVAIHLDDLRTQRAWTAAYPDRPHLQAASRFYLTTVSSVQQGLESAETAVRARNYVVAHYADVITNDLFWANPNLSGDLTLGERALLVQAVVGSAAPSERAREEADRSIGPAVRRIEQEDKVELWFMVLVMGFVGALLYGVVDFLAALRAQPGIALRAVGLAVVDRRGRPAGRLRLLGRWTVVWGALAALGAAGAGLPMARDLVSGLVFPVANDFNWSAPDWTMVPLFLGVLLLTAAVARAVLRPDCGWQDQVAGTRIVLQ